MAEAYLRKRAEEENLDMEVRSAGTFGIEGATPSLHTLKVLQDIEINTEGYKSTKITPELINWADIVLVMEPEHKEDVLNLVPEAAGKVYYLRQFDKEPGDISIPDPIGRTVAFYKTSLKMIQEPIEEFIKWVQ